jgi:hypothetical protein
MGDVGEGHRGQLARRISSAGAHGVVHPEEPAGVARVETRHRHAHGRTVESQPEGSLRGAQAFAEPRIVDGDARLGGEHLQQLPLPRTRSTPVEGKIHRQHTDQLTRGSGQRREQGVPRMPRVRALDYRGRRRSARRAGPGPGAAAGRDAGATPYLARWAKAMSAGQPVRQLPSVASVAVVGSQAQRSHLIRWRVVLGSRVGCRWGGKNTGAAPTGRST